MSEREVVLSARDLRKYYPIKGGVLQRQVGEVKAVDGVSFDLYEGQTLGIVGESGSGKSVTSTTILGLNRGTNAQISGQIDFDGDDLLTIKEDRMRELRGRKMAMIFQDPLSSLTPVFTVGAQIVEALAETRDFAQLGLHVGQLRGDFLRVSRIVPQGRVACLRLELAGALTQFVDGPVVVAAVLAALASDGAA